MGMLPMSATIRDQEEQDLRIDQMAINIEKLRQDIRLDNHRFTMQLLAIIAGSTIALTTLATFVLRALGK
jgi:hypothetical protein